MPSKLEKITTRFLSNAKLAKEEIKQEEKPKDESSEDEKPIVKQPPPSKKRKIIELQSSDDDDKHFSKAEVTEGITFLLQEVKKLKKSVKKQITKQDLKKAISYESDDEPPAKDNTITSNFSKFIVR